MTKKKPKYYVRPDGLHEAIRVINGKRVPFRGKTDAEVEQKMIAYKEKEERGPLFSEVAEKWEVAHFPTISPATAKGYTASYKRAKERFGELPIKNLTANDVDAMLKQMGKQQYARKTVATQLLVISLIFQHAMLKGTIRYNPCSAVKIPSGLKHTPRLIPTDEELQLVKDGWNSPGGLLPYFILYTGCRRGEALAITYKDIDYKRKIISINKSVCYAKGGPIVKAPKSTAGTREIPLLDKLSAVLPRGIGSALLFPGIDGKIIKQSTYQGRWKHWQESAGVTLTAHQLRHGFATMLYEAGIDEREAMEYMGHADITLTRTVYTHIRKSRRDATAAKLNETANNF